MNDSHDTLSQTDRVLFDLVSTPSVSGNEAAAAKVFVQHAQALGLDTEIDEAGNTVAHYGPANSAAHIVLLGHIDTVPGDLPVFIQDGTLHGRGSVDAKGPLAAMLMAVSRLDLQDDIRVTVAGAVGEEIAGSPGARHLAKKYRPTACIIGEPSGWDGVTLGYKGCVSIEATNECEIAHSAGPNPSAGDDLLTWWSKVIEFITHYNQSHSRIFDQIQATVRGLSSADDGLKQYATLKAGFRLPIAIHPDEMVTRLQDTIAILEGGSITIKATGEESAVRSDRNDPVVQALSQAIRSHDARPRPKLKTGTADFNVVAPIWRCPIAAYGPGDSSLDHTPHERLSLTEYHRSIDILHRTITTLAKTPSEI